MDHESKLVWFGFLYISEFSVDLDVYASGIIAEDMCLHNMLTD